MTSIKKFEVGDKVTVFGGTFHDGYRPLKTQIVNKVFKKYIVLDNKTKWNTDGRPYPQYEGYHRPTIKITTQEHLNEMRVFLLRNLIDHWTNKGMKEADLKTLESVYKIIKTKTGKTSS